jgi:DNA ligase-4
MPFPFTYVCDLLQRLSDNQSATSGQKPTSKLVEDWFAQHRSRLVRDDFNHAPLLSTLLPEKRTDRVYNIQSKTLQGLFGRALCLGRSRLEELGRWEMAGLGIDLADCIEHILETTVSIWTLIL